jgi:hypothetical protein
MLEFTCTGEMNFASVSQNSAKREHLKRRPTSPFTIATTSATTYAANPHLFSPPAKRARTLFDEPTPAVAGNPTGENPLGADTPDGFVGPDSPMGEAAGASNQRRPQQQQPGLRVNMQQNAPLMRVRGGFLQQTMANAMLCPENPGTMCTEAGVDLTRPSGICTRRYEWFSPNKPGGG